MHYLFAPTGRAAYNIHGCTIHRAFMIAANQKLEHRALSWDHLNTLRNRFHGIKWILLDEFSMVWKHYVETHPFASSRSKR